MARASLAVDANLRRGSSDERGRGNKFLCRTGQDASPVPASAHDVLASQESALEALWALEDGQTLRLGVPEVQLNATVVISASHIIIRGAPGMTRVGCPPAGNVFIVE